MQIQGNYSQASERFGLVAQKYCGLIESRSTLDRTEFLLNIYRLLPELIAEGMALPNVEFGEDGNEEQEVRTRKARLKTQITQEEWSQLYNSLKEKLEVWNLYREVFDPWEDTDAIHWSLADDIADIYRDLKNGIGLALINEVPLEEIIFDWREEFYGHWGKHAIAALRAIHYLLEDLNS